MTVDKNRIWMIGSVLVTVVVVVLGWLIGIQPQLSAASAAEEQRAAVEATNASHAGLLASLKEDFKDIGALEAELASLAKSVPTGTEMPAFVNQLDALAGSNKVTLAGMTVAEAQPYTPVAAPVAPAAPNAAPGASTPGASEGAAQTTALAAGVPPVVDASITADNFAAMSVQITIKGGYGNVLDFVNGLQTGTRLFMATGLNTSATSVSSGEDEMDEGGETDETVNATISGLIYVLVTPESARVTAAG